MRLLFVGPQGSGKGTQAKIISKEFNISHISTGDSLREATGALSDEIHSYIDGGNLVPDELMLRVLNDRICKEDCKDGFILDGFPRNLEQANALEKIISVDKVLEIAVSDEESFRRIPGRYDCKGCGNIYNVDTEPKPAIYGFCDSCDSELRHRADDNKEALNRRLEIYHTLTEPVLGFYDSVRINGEQPIEKVTQDIRDSLR
jgi:adenylate kinase